MQNKSAKFALDYKSRIYAPVAQLDRVLGYEPSGQEFESLQARHIKKETCLVQVFLFIGLRLAQITHPHSDVFSSRLMSGIDVRKISADSVWFFESKKLELGDNGV